VGCDFFGIEHFNYFKEITAIFRPKMQPTALGGAIRLDGT
jgi:hypothetical protein